ncbi:MAG: hypothetical protein KJN93_00405 [Alphaproteobacteria bacterium]|nr:hypothetical protein [Alphaproteobacteria bacterium]
MRLSKLFVVSMLSLAACAAVPPDAEVLRDDDLAAAVSGRMLTVTPPEGSDMPDGMMFFARLQPEGVALMSAELNGEPSPFFSQTQSWSVQGQSLCIFGGDTPEPSDCIQADWVSPSAIQLTETRRDGTTETNIATITPL